jgi:hypothetical protein
MQTYKTVTTNPHINDELLLVSRMDYAMRIILCLLVLVVSIDDAICQNVSRL